MTDEQPASEQSDDPSLVRPYVASLTHLGPASRRSRLTRAAVESATMLLPLQPSRRSAPGPDSPHDARRGVSGRLRTGLVGVAVIVLAGSVTGGYLAWRQQVKPIAVSSEQLPVIVPNAPATSASANPVTSPSSAHAAAPPGPTRAPSPSAHALTSETPKSLVGTASAAATPKSDANLAAGRSIVDSGHADVYVASNAVDGDPNTYWESVNNAFPQSITVDLGATVTVGRLVLRLPPKTAWGARTQMITILGSLRGARFTTIVGTGGHAFDPASGNTATITFPATTARYVRLTFSGNTGWPAGQVSEIEIYAA